MNTRNIILAMVAALAIAAGGAVVAQERGEGRGEAGEGEHAEGAEDGGEGAGDGEEAATQYGKMDTYDVIRAGARLILNYDAASQSFVGTVANTTSGVLSNVRIEVHLSNGTELGPTTPIDLAPGDVIPVTLPASGEVFDTWTAHPEVGSQGGGGG